MPQVNISDVIDRSRVTSFQWMTYVLCALCLIMDGYDVQAMGYVAPALTRQWNIPPATLGPVLSAALVGVLIGSLFCSTLADRIGRRPVLILGSLYFAVLTLATGAAQSVTEILVIRFFAGIGLGGMMPNAMSLVGEYSPKRIRVAVMMVVSSGFTAGAMIGGFIAAWLIPAFGWRAVFYFGGSIPLVLGLVMIPLLPESLQFLALRGKNRDKMLGWLRRIDPSADSSTQYIVREEKKEGIPAIHLFREGRTPVTLLLWVLNFMNLLNLYFLASWMPTVAARAGYTTVIAVLLGTSVQVGGTIGSFGNAWLIEKLGFVGALAPIFAIGSLSIACIGQPGLAVPLLFTAVFIAGWSVPGGQPGVNALAAIYYPTYLRSTGIGWGLGIGRIGAIVGPIVGGILIANKWTPREVFYAAAVPAAIAALTMIALRGFIKRPALAERTAEAVAH
jgi:AAHS family 4-hydroxybenzoate transporter-like MFS transporter